MDKENKLKIFYETITTQQTVTNLQNNQCGAQPCRKYLTKYEERI